MNFFGSKKEAPPQPQEKTLQNMNKDELREKQRAMKKELQKEIREIDRQHLNGIHSQTEFLSGNGEEEGRGSITEGIKEGT